MTEPRNASDQMAELKAKLATMGFTPVGELGKLAQLFALSQVTEVAAPGLSAAMAKGERMLHEIAAMSCESLDSLHRRYGPPPKLTAGTAFNRGDLLELKTQVELYNGVIESAKRYYAYNGRFPGDE